MNYHERMMNVQINGKSPDTYIHGHRDARHACAEIALEAQAEIERLRSALVRCVNVSDLPREVERIAFAAGGRQPAGHPIQ